jgi:hypothetical protein
VVLDAVVQPTPRGLLARRGEIVARCVDVDRPTGSSLEQREVHGADARTDVEHDGSVNAVGEDDVDEFL